MGRVGFPQYTSCSYKPIVAFEFAMPKDPKDIKVKIPTLFVMSVLNYKEFTGNALSSEAYSSYPAESELLLQGFMHVLAVNKKVKLENGTGALAKYNGIEFTVIHIFIPDTYTGLY